MKGIANEGKEGMADYKKDGGNKMQFGKDEAQNLKGVSLLVDMCRSSGTLAFILVLYL